MSARELVRRAYAEAEEQNRMFRNAVGLIHVSLGWTDIRPFSEVCKRIEELVAHEKATKPADAEPEPPPLIEVPE